MNAFLNKNRSFIFCCVIIAAVYLLDSLVFFSQLYKMYDLFSPKTISAVSTGWAYLAQGAGMLFFIILYKTRSQISAKKVFQVVLFLIEVPVIIVSILIPDKTLLMCMIVVLNIDSLIIALVVVVILVYRDAVKDKKYADGGTKAVSALKSDTDRGRKVLILMCVVIAIMAPISSIGTNNNLYLEYCQEFDLLAQRCFYAVGLIAAGLIYDKNRKIGGICTVVSLIYPTLLIMIYRESGMVTLVIGLSYAILGFFAVYRAASFMTWAAESDRLHLAPLGLAVSRVCEAIAVLVIIETGCGELASVILVSVLFIPLVILFFMMVREKYAPTAGDRVAEHPKEISADERRASFAKQYGLTRREEEVAMFLSEGRSNGEIAEILQLSENTVRFHVSNVLKKTGMKERTGCK